MASNNGRRRAGYEKSGNLISCNLAFYLNWIQWAVNNAIGPVVYRYLVNIVSQPVCCSQVIIHGVDCNDSSLRSP